MCVDRSEKMKERELWTYREGVQEYILACEDLQEFEDKVLSARSTKTDDVPRDCANPFPDRVAPKLTAHAMLLSRRDSAAKKMEVGLALLYRVREALKKEEERTFLWCRYQKGMTLPEIEKHTHRGRTSVYRDKLAALERIKDM